MQCNIAQNILLIHKTLWKFVQRNLLNIIFRHDLKLYQNIRKTRFGRILGYRLKLNESTPAPWGEYLRPNHSRAKHYSHLWKTLITSKHIYTKQHKGVDDGTFYYQTNIATSWTNDLILVLTNMNLSDLNPNPARIVAVTIDMSPHQCNPTPSVSFSQRNSTLSPSRSPYLAHVNSN